MKLKKDVHSVKRFSIQVEYPEVKTAKDAQDRILFIIKNKLTHILEDACNKHDKGDLVRISKMTLDLGDIPKTELEGRLPEIFKKKVDYIFSGFNINIYSASELEGVEVIDEEKQIVTYFTYYLKYGTLPWYMQNAIGDNSFDEVFAYLIEKNDVYFIEEFFNILEHPNARRRLVRFFDSGQIMQIFKKNLPEEFYNSIWALYKEITKFISNSNEIESTFKTYLILYLKEFLLIISAKAKKTDQIYSLDVLTTRYVEFVSKEKNISPEKWLSSIFFSKITQSNTYAAAIILSMQNYYTNYLLDEKLSPILSKIDKLTDKTQFYNWLVEKQSVTGRYLSRAIEDIVIQVSSHISSIEKEKLEQIVLEIASDIIPDVLIAIENVDKWIHAINQRVTEIFGVALEQQLKDEKGKQFNISLARDYLELFIKSGLSPFRKLYQDPEKVLKDLFRKYLDEEAGAKTFLKEQVEADIMVSWRMKEAFGKDFLADKDIFPKEKEYDYLLLVSFIRTGVLPWAEIVEKGHEDLVERIIQFTSQEKKSTLIKVLIDENFYKKEGIMEKVFDAMSVDFGKELLRIRKELVSKGLIDLSIIYDAPEDSLDLRLVDGLANQIIEFSNLKTLDILLRKKQANLIFDAIVKSTRKALYETAAMLVSFDKNIIDTLMDVLDKAQKDFIKKLVRNYRARFVSIAEEIKDSEKREEQKQALVEEEFGDTFYINNAGLVLLSVYMKRLFTRLDLVNKKEFKSDEARERAVYILQYLVSKNDNPEEYELILNKTFVGMPFGVPLKFDTKITDEEKEICDNLLGAVIENWSVLKNTSVDGLRTSFLLRSGSLKKLDAEWRLHVEKKAYDVLLSKLPWGYTTIHLPWMKKPLFVEWEG